MNIPQSLTFSVESFIQLEYKSFSCTLVNFVLPFTVRVDLQVNNVYLKNKQCLMFICLFICLFVFFNVYLFFAIIKLRGVSTKLNIMFIYFFLDEYPDLNLINATFQDKFHHECLV